MSTPPKITITDVAKAAGVALGTVSRVLNHHPAVNEGIRQHVMATAHRLGYSRLRQRGRTARPELRARPVRRGVVGVVIFGMEDTLVQLPVVSAALQGIERALANEGRSLMLATIARGDRVPPFLKDSRLEGLILKGPNRGLLPDPLDNHLLRELYRHPYVWLMGRLPNAVGDHCNFDTNAAGRIAALHLRERGHRQVAFLNPKPGQTQFEKLQTAFVREGRELGLVSTLLQSEPPSSLQWPLAAISLQENVDRLVDVWSELPPRQRPTALFVPSDRTSTQLYSALGRRGLRVGHDVSVISCNNEKSLLVHLHPAITTIEVHAELIGRRAVDQLLWRVANRSEPTECTLLVTPTLVPGDSVATRPGS